MKGYRGGTIMYDSVEHFGKGSIIQHGKLNDRIYLMKLDENDVVDIIIKLSTLADKYNYSKLFCKVPKNLAPLFFANGYTLEAFVPKFYNGKTDVFFVSKFLNPERLLNLEKDQFSVLSKLISNKPKNKKKPIAEYSSLKLNELHVNQITSIYRRVFESYPFPIHNPSYIKETMNNNVQYFGVQKNKEIVALASSEIDLKGGNAEMTDFATLPAHSGNNLATILLNEMEVEMKNKGIRTLYTIARVNSTAMNITFLKGNYQYSGTLLKNTNIAGKIESMNVYYKHI